MAGSPKVQQRKHVPRRTCVACGKASEKRSLVRIVRTPSGTLEIDERGKKPGRGAYLCVDGACWDEALKRRRLDHALKTAFSTQDRAMLREVAGRLLSNRPA